MTKTTPRSVCTTWGVLLICALVVGGCRSVYYTAYERFGIYKRDLLKKSVIAARDEQKSAGAQFESALAQIKSLSGFDGGEIENAYLDLQKDYDHCSARAGHVRKRIRDMETVAADLFKEWEKEIQEISTPMLRQGSEQQLRATRQRYDVMRQALLNAEKALDPALRQFKDYVLSLKHALNAQAVASLKGEAANIEAEISRLMSELNQSIAQADEFIKGLS